MKRAGRGRQHCRSQVIRKRLAVAAVVEEPCELRYSLCAVRNFERFLRASFRLGTRAAHGLDTPFLAASGRLRAPRQSGVKHELMGPPPGQPRAYMDSSPAAESFRDLLLRRRGRTELTDLPDCASANRRTGRDWEAAR